MQTGETVCLWKYQFENNGNPSSSPMNHLSSTKKGAMDGPLYWTCTERQACADQMSSKATFCCPQCHSFQCEACEKHVHANADMKNHQRLNLDELDDESCSIDQTHPAFFYCPACAQAFCYSCFEDRHQHLDKKQHIPQKCREQQIISTKKNTVHRHPESKPMKISATSKTTSKERTAMPQHSPFDFEDVNVNDSDESQDSPPIQYIHSPPGKSSNSKVPQHNKNNHHHNRNLKPDHLDQRMLHDSMIEGDDDETDSPIDKYPIMKQSHRPLSHRLSLNNESSDVFLLLDGVEHLTVNSASDFRRQLKSTSDDPSVKCISIIGNTGDGKSHTLNQVFFDGEEKFSTSSSTDSCTMGVWAALDDSQRTLILDTEGRLGLSQNDNIRNRLLLKILCVSDVVVFRTKAPKLPNDMFQFLSDASSAFLKYFKKEIESVMKNCKVDGPMSAMGPTLIVFHETQYTEVLKDHLQCQKTAVEQLKERFDKMKLSYDAYSSIEYVGIQTPGGKQTDFGLIKATITSILENNKIRSPRRLSVIFKSLKALNEKFNHDIPPEMPSTLPDDFFSCCFKCLSCETKCVMPANHQKENIPHQCDKKCSYSKELDNEVWKCLACHREGRDMIVYGKLITKSDGLVQGLLKYVWSGFVIECPHHGEIYRSRKYWFGNNEPKDVTRAELIHVWPGDEINRLPCDVTPRKFMEMIVYAGSYLSAPTKMLTELVADQVAPAYWVPNKDVENCYSCRLKFGADFSKHHCRACGQVFCDTCSIYRTIVPWIDSDKPVRVCKQCHDTPKSRPPPSISTPSSSATQSDRNKPNGSKNRQNGYENGSSGDSTSTVSSGEHLSDLCLTPNDIFDIDQPRAGPGAVEMPTTRRVYETVMNGLEKIGANYPITLIKESTRPNYWRPDHECRACFICKIQFNYTTNRLHHCRNCGDGVCENCSPNKRCVPERDWLTPVRVCRKCDQEMNESNQ